MIVEGPFDRVELDAALRHINHARVADADERERARGFLRGLERLLAATSTGTERERDGGQALEDLDVLLAGAGADADTRSLERFLAPIIERLIEALLDHPERRLASDASHNVADLVGEWCDGEVREPDVEPVPILLFESAALPNHWDRLDALEGSGTRRILVPVDTPAGLRVANLYARADELD